MAVIRFLNDSITVHAPPGTWLADLAAEIGASVPFNCRVGRCGRCLVTVEEGQDLLVDPEEGEREMLAKKCARPGQRLCCQAVVGAQGTISLRWKEGGESEIEEAEGIVLPRRG